MNDERLIAIYRDILAGRDPAARPSCPPPEAILGLVERTGHERDRLGIANHVMGCPGCLPEFELLRALTAAAPAQRALPRWTALAAGVALLLGAGILWRAATPATEDPLRGAAPVVLVAPPDGARAGLPVALRWRAVPDARQYRVEVLTERGAALLVEETTDTAATLAAVPEGHDALLWQVTAELHSGLRVQSPPQRFRLDR